MSLPSAFEANHFSEERNQVLYRCLEKLDLNEDSNVPTLERFLSAAQPQDLTSSGGAARLRELAMGVGSIQATYGYAEQLIDLAAQRGYETTLKELLRRHSIGEQKAVEEAVEEAVSQLFVLRRQEAGGALKSPLKVVQQLNDDMEKTRQRLADGTRRVVGLATGFHRLDNITQGFHGSELIILAARPGMGKTAFSLNVAASAGMPSSGTDVPGQILVASLEMPAVQLFHRIIALTEQVNLSVFRHPIYDTDMTKSKIERGMERLSHSGIHTIDSIDLTPRRLKGIAREMHAKPTGLDLIVIDYLQLMSPNEKSSNRQQEVASISRDLKLLSLELQVPVLALSQLNRNPVVRQGNVPMRDAELSDLRDSGALEQDADVVLFLDSDTTGKLGTKDSGDIDSAAEAPARDQGEAVRLRVMKNRHGQTGVIPYQFRKNISRFVELP